MDANGLRFWMLAENAEWHRWGDPSATEYDSERRTLRLANQRAAEQWFDHAGVARSRLGRVPAAIDAFGTRAFLRPASGDIMAEGVLPTPVVIYTAPSPMSSVTDFTMGANGVFYIAVDGAIVLLDRRERWRPVTLNVADFTAWRFASDPNDGVWVIDPIRRTLASVVGEPLPDRPYGPYASDVFRPCNENANPPRIAVHAAASWPEEDEAVAIACSPGGRLALLTWSSGGADARVRVLNADGTFGAAVTLAGAHHPYSMAWVSDTDIAVLLPDTPAHPITEAPVYTLPADGDGGVARPLGDFYPLRDHDDGPFLHTPSVPPHYGSAAGPAPLVRLSLPSFASKGSATGAMPFDGGRHTVWHRLYLEASIPPGCGVRVWLAASDKDAMPIGESEWHQHRFGAVPEPPVAGVPTGAWVGVPSEIPFHQGLIACPRVKNRSGLFTALIQRAGLRVRPLRGRYLSVRVELYGTGRATPEIAAVRAYASRFSYVDRYLPELYRETVFGADADQPGTSTPADFLERFLGNFEGVLTPLEDRISNAHLLTDPRTVPDESIEWLGGWVGLTFDSALPVDRRRALVEATPTLYRARGTPRGLALALEVATGGGVSSGEIVVLEDFRLRRTFATILGADLADENDPLLAGLVSSGNSFVGDTLFLGDEHRQEFLALFNADTDLTATASERNAIAHLFDDLANRVTVLVHQEVEPQDLGLISRILTLESPAHVLGRVVTASYSFLIGMASLVGVDTYLGRRTPIGPVRIERSHLGVRDRLQRPPSLDPRLEGGGSGIGSATDTRPDADAGSAENVRFGESFTLDASRSRASPGRTLARFDWRIDS